MFIEKDMKITNNLTLLDITSIHRHHNEPEYISLEFEFYDMWGQVVVKFDNLTNDYPIYTSTEIDSDIASSFNDALEDNWGEIRTAILKWRKEEENENTIG